MEAVMDSLELARNFFRQEFRLLKSGFQKSAISATDYNLPVIATQQKKIVKILEELNSGQCNNAIEFLRDYIYVRSQPAFFKNKNIMQAMQIKERRKQAKEILNLLLSGNPDKKSQLEQKEKQKQDNWTKKWLDFFKKKPEN